MDYLSSMGDMIKATEFIGQSSGLFVFIFYFRVRLVCSAALHYSCCWRMCFLVFVFRKTVLVFGLCAVELMMPEKAKPNAPLIIVHFWLI